LTLITQFYDLIFLLVHFILQIDQHLEGMITQYGIFTYLILFLIVFAETGLIVTPFLPGDSLLFAAGTLAGRGLLSLPMLMGLIFLAAVLGDTLNYAVGRFFGLRLFNENSRFLKKEYLEKTHQFYAKHGEKTIVLCRFVPIIRTFAPFVAGLGNMHYGKYMSYNIIGGALWVLLFLGLGYAFGDLPIIRKSLTLTMMAIVGLSLLPLVYETWAHWRRGRGATK
jgi:membrane-associated protein